MKSIVVKPVLEIVGLKKYKQGELIVWRLLIKNNGNDIANDVQAEISKLYDGIALRINYLPAPLRWTHSQYLVGNNYFYNGNRNIHPGQMAYLDLFDQIPDGDELRIRIATTIFLDSVPDFSILKKGESKIELKIFEKNTKPTFANVTAKLGKDNFEANLNN